MDSVDLLAWIVLVVPNLQTLSPNPNSYTSKPEAYTLHPYRLNHKILVILRSLATSHEAV